MSFQTTIENVFIFSPPIFFGIILILSIVFFFQKKDDLIFSHQTKKLFWSVLIFRIFYSLSQTIAQYYFWKKNPMTQIFLNIGINQNSPIASSLKYFPFLFEKFGYFLFFSYGRFWLTTILSFLISFLFYYFLTLLAKKESRFFYEGEIELGTLYTLLLGWPLSLFFIPISFLFVVINSLFRKIILKETYTSLGVSFLLAAIFVFLLGQKIFSLTGGEILKL